VTAVAAIAIVAFLPSLTGGWLYDDDPLIANNQYIHSFEHWPRWFVEDFWNLDEEFVRHQARIIYWRPLVSVSYAVDWQVSGGSPVWFHVTNLVAHAIASVLAFFVLRRWLGGTAAAAFAAALVWVVHPTKAESVAWISGRTDVFCMVGILLACEGIARRRAGRRRLGITLEAIGTLVAYMCKEQAIVLPAFAAIESWVASERPALDRRVVFRMLRDAAPQLAVAVLYLGLRKAFMPIQAANVEGSLPLGPHVLAVLESFGRFFELTFMPHDLSVQQGLVDISKGELVRSMPHVVAGAAGLLVLIAVAVAARRRAPIVTVGIVFYLATILPTSNIVYSQMRTLISERFLYLPIFGIALIIGWALDRVRVRGLWALVAAIVVATTALSVSRSADFRDPKTFWERELKLHPTSYFARRMVVLQQLRDKRYANALNDVLRMHSLNLRDRLEVSLLAAQVVAGVLPDHDRASLEALDRFCAELLEAKSPAAVLAVRELTYTMPTVEKNFRKELDGVRLHLAVLRADIASRLGADDRAVELATNALASCPKCLGVASLSALAVARAGRYDEALKILDNIQLPAGTLIIRKMITTAVDARDRALVSQGSAQLQARATELAALELWGRAYDVLAPHKEEIKHAPKAVMGFAELALRAGQPAVAREMLATQLSPELIEAQLTEWSFKMGWL